ncbi:hypothetical protein ACTA71_008368 [Dictyostelium dimigraforme]
MDYMRTYFGNIGDTCYEDHSSFASRFFFSHIFMKEIYFFHEDRSIVLDTSKRKIIFKNDFFKYLPKLEKIFSNIGNNFTNIKYNFSDFGIVIPNSFFSRFIQIEPYSFLLNWLRDLKSNILILNVPISSIYNRIKEIENIINETLEEKIQYLSQINMTERSFSLFSVDIMGDNKIGITSFCEIFNNLYIDKFSFIIQERNKNKDNEAFILAYSVDDEKSFKNIEFYYEEIKNLIKKNTILLLVGLKSDLVKPQRKVTYNDGKELANKLGIKIFFETSSRDNYNCHRIFNFINFELSQKLNFNFDEFCRLTISNFLQELDYSTDLTSNKLLITYKQKEQRAHHVILELIFCIDLPIVQFINEIKSLDLNEKGIIKLFKNDMIEMNSVVFKLLSLKSKKNHQHILYIDEKKKLLYKNFKKLFIYSKIENYKEITKSLSKCYSYNIETTNFIKSYLNDNSMYSKKDYENLIQDISWCDNIILRAILIGNFELIEYYKEINQNFDFSNYSPIINLKNKSKLI